MAKIKPFPKRTYGSLREPFVELFAILSNPEQMRKVLRSGQVSPAFRERLMLAVTQVNDCRYCSRFHSAEALRMGVRAEEIEMLKQGEIHDDVPASEVTALRYARLWAECDAQPAEVETRRLIDAYGQETADTIHILLRMIRIGNLSGNTWDSWLYRLSGGRWGLPQNRSG